MDTHRLSPRPTPPSSADQGVRWDAVVRALCEHRRDTGDLLTAYLSATPADVPALCLRGFTQLFLGRDERRPEAAAAEAAARDALGASGGTRRDRALLAALAAWREDRPAAAADAFDAMLADDPRDLLAIKLQHGLLLMAGEAGRMRRSLEHVLPHWRPRDPDRGYVLGCYAFSLEETGDFERAEAAGREAVALQPRDAWAIHAVAHVFESLGRAREGLTWLGANTAGYAECNVFLGHVHWHRALLHFQIEEFGRALDIYDAHVATPWVGDYRDMSNAVSLLWRLETEGVDVGDRWRRLARIAAGHVADRGSAFALAHYALALGRGDAPAVLSQAIAGLPAAPPAGRTPDSQRAVVAEVGRPLCLGIEALCAGNAAAAYAALAPLEPVLWRIGGSHAQRDLFGLMLIHVALAAGELAAARQLIATRQVRRPHDPWLSTRAAAAA
ncbi:MAG: hypothetical protein R2708_18150 [Vicinamibacterales bacterium]